MNELSDVAAIVLNYNCSKDTIACLRSLSMFLKQGLKVVIVDNCSTDCSVKMIENYLETNNDNVFFIKSDTNSGYNAGNNIGIRFALQDPTIRFVTIVNPDVLFYENSNPFFEMKHALLSNKKYAFAGCFPQSLDGIDQIAFWDYPKKAELFTHHFLFSKRRTTTYTKSEVPSVIEVECVIGSLCMIKKDFILEINLLDDGFFLYNEENMLGYMANRKNMVGIVCENTNYIHNHKRKVDIDYKRARARLKQSYLSRKHLCESMGKKKYIFPLFLVQLMNYFVIDLRYLFKNGKK